MSSLPALSIRGLTKRYDSGLLALDELGLEVPDGEFLGLLGPNGAGNTTLISAPADWRAGRRLNAHPPTETGKTSR